MTNTPEFRLCAVASVLAMVVVYLTEWPAAMFVAVISIMTLACFVVVSLLFDLDEADEHE